MKVGGKGVGKIRPLSLVTLHPLPVVHSYSRLSTVPPFPWRASPLFMAYNTHPKALFDVFDHP